MFRWRSWWRVEDVPAGVLLPWVVESCLDYSSSVSPGAGLLFTGVLDGGSLFVLFLRAGDESRTSHGLVMLGRSRRSRSECGKNFLAIGECWTRWFAESFVSEGLLRRVWRGSSVGGRARLVRTGCLVQAL